MAKTYRFKSVSGGRLSIYAGRADGLGPIEIPAGGVYETDDPVVVKVLQASPDVVEVKSSKK